MDLHDTGQIPYTSFVTSMHQMKVANISKMIVLLQSQLKKMAAQVDHNQSIIRRLAGEKGTDPPAGTANSPEIDPERAPGIITGRMIAGHSLRNADLFGKSDPYMQVSIPSNEEVKTRVVKESCDPVWNQDFKLVAIPDDKSLSFKVYDADHGGIDKDDLLGEYEIEFRKLEAGKPYTKRVALDGGKGGEIEFEVKWEAQNFQRGNGHEKPEKEVVLDVSPVTDVMGYAQGAVKEPVAVQDWSDLEMHFSAMSRRIATKLGPIIGNGSSNDDGIDSALKNIVSAVAILDKTLPLLSNDVHHNAYDSLGAGHPSQWRTQENGNGVGMPNQIFRFPADPPLEKALQHREGTTIGRCGECR